MQTDLTIYVVPNSAQLVASVQEHLNEAGMRLRGFDSLSEFVKLHEDGISGCLLLDLEEIDRCEHDCAAALAGRELPLPTVALASKGDVQAAVMAVKSGAVEVLEKPVAKHDLLRALDEALRAAEAENKKRVAQAEARRRLSTLTSRERQVMDRILEGRLTKEIAGELGISVRTAEAHRAHIMRKLGASSAAVLARIALLADLSPKQSPDDV